jgi:Aldo/keto reductase family
LHWRGSVPLAETLEAFQTLQQAGKIRAYGVSNFDAKEMEAASSLKGGDAIATDQPRTPIDLASLAGILHQLSMACLSREGVPSPRQNVAIGVPKRARSLQRQGINPC